MRLKNILTNIGLTNNEAKCYLALLKFGSLTIQELSAKTGIHRVNLYSVIQSLEIKGAVSFTVKGKYRKQIVPSNPRGLIELIHKKQRILKKAELKFTDMIPELTGMMRQAKEQTSIRYFEGLEGAKQVFNDTLTAVGDLKGFSNVDILHEYIPEKLMDEYRRRKSDLRLTGRFIVPLSPQAKNYVAKKYTTFGLLNVPEVKCLPADLFNFFAEMDMYDDKVSIVSLSHKEQIGIIIESKAVFKSFASIFEVMWQMAKSV